jgi:hypothetical protein
VVAAGVSTALVWHQLDASSAAREAGNRAPRKAAATGVEPRERRVEALKAVSRSRVPNVTDSRVHMADDDVPSRPQPAEEAAIPQQEDDDPVQLPEEWYRAVTAEQSHDGPRQREVRQKLDDLVRAGRLEGTEVVSVECFSSACEIVLESKSRAIQVGVGDTVASAKVGPAAFTYDSDPFVTRVYLMEKQTGNAKADLANVND